MPLSARLDSTSEFFLSVAIPRPLPGFFSYSIPKDWISRVSVGSRVRVPFGRAVTQAFVVELPRRISELPAGLSASSLKGVLEIVEEDDGQKLFSEDLWALCRWAQDYYFSPLGEILNCAAPKANAIRSKMAKKRGGGKKRKTLSDSSASFSPRLTEDQNRAVSDLNEMRAQLSPPVALLRGVTGSGKTEVYIELARKVLAEDRAVIILVPEIALTSQLHRRFEARLGVQVALWHSAVSDGRRREEAAAIRTGEIRVVVGARSAVFAPVLNLGLVIVDEEHDATYKQEDRVRYHARDLAIVRSNKAKAFTLLGSATPSLETLERVREGRYGVSALPHRISAGGEPRVELVDLKVRSEVVKMQSPLSLKTIQTIQETIRAGEQVIVYLNRRGFAAFLLCKDCGEVKGCPQCSISLTVYKRSTVLRCHICNYEERIPDACGKCQSTELIGMGSGTESLEGDLTQLISGARITRLDRDQITSMSRLEKVLDEFRNGASNILLGTQMLVKGHDFPGVTLVVVILADGLFRWPDFRAGERAFQVLKQVAGRAGRGDKAGRVLIQAYDLDHPVLKVLLGEASEESFIEGERELRRALGYTPFGRLARLRFENISRQKAMDRAVATADQVRADCDASNLSVLGPSTAFTERMKGMYRWDILLKAKNIQALHKAVHSASAFCAGHKWQFIVDVDPYGV